LPSNRWGPPRRREITTRPPSSPTRRRREEKRPQVERPEGVLKAERLRLSKNFKIGTVVGFYMVLLI
jgi:hypothetical protein